MRGNFSYFALWLIAVLFPAISHAAVYNGGFEIIDPNSPAEFNAPDGWARENYAAVTDRLLPLDQNIIYWKIDLEQGLRPIQGDSFVALCTNFSPFYLETDPTYAVLEQYVYAFPGQTLSGYYFFGTADYPGYYDYATIVLAPVDSNLGLRNITIVDIGVEDVGSNSSTEGWIPFQHTFSSTEQGAYYLTLSVADYIDNAVPSWLAVDAVVLCNNPPDNGDINNDCHVDMKDLSWLAVDWLENCNDPNYFTDPNSNCYKGTDLDGNGPIDVNDLILITNNWLSGS